MNWYAKKAGNDTQGLIIDEETGRTVAVAYDSRDTALLAAAPNLLKALENANTLLTQLLPGVRHIALQDYGFLNSTLLQVTAAIADAKGEL